MMFFSSSVAFLHLHYTTVNNYTVCKTVKGVKGIFTCPSLFLSRTQVQKLCQLPAVRIICLHPRISNLSTFIQNKQKRPILGYSQAKQAAKKVP